MLKGGSGEIGLCLAQAKAHAYPQAKAPKIHDFPSANTGFPLFTFWDISPMVTSWGVIRNAYIIENSPAEMADRDHQI